MKILKLRLKNIHSLKGEHLIDFTVSPLADAGLFAITGPTGAGKSTILDVITLALFNKMPRFASKGTESISRNDIEKIGSVMTHFTDEAYAEIEYECNQICYRSKWSISRARTGNLRDYEMELATLADNKIFDLKKSEVPAENERLLGLKYEQFIRSILLSQGDFARFLKSDDKERAKLLEDITASHIYREIGRKVYDSSKSIEEELKTLRQQAELIMLLPAESLLQKEQTLKENVITLKSIGETIETLSLNLLKSEKKHQLLLKLKQTQDAILSLHQKKDAFTAKGLRLSKHQALDAHRGHLTLWENEKRSLSKLASDIHQFRLQLVIAKDNLYASLAKISAFVQSPVTEDSYLTQMKGFENRISDLDNQLTQLTQKGKTLREQCTQIMEKNAHLLSVSFKGVNSVEEQLHIVTEKKSSLEQWPTLFEGSSSALEIAIHQLHEQTIVWMSMLNDIKNKETFLADNALLQKQLEVTENDILLSDKQLELLRIKLEEIKHELEVANAQKQHWLQIASLDDHRQTLKDGLPCPLCGAIHHPYAENLPLKIGENEIHIQQLTILLSANEKTYQEIKTQAAIGRATIQSHTLRKEENEIKIKQIEVMYPDKTMTSAMIGRELEDKNQILTTYKNEARIRSENEVLVEIIAILVELQDITAIFRQVRDSRTALYSGNDINDEVDKLHRAYTLAKETVQSLEVTIKNTEDHKHSSETKWNKLTEDLLKHITLLDYKSIEDAISCILPDEELKYILSEKEELVKEETELNASHSQTLEELSHLNEISSEPTLIDRMKSDIGLLNKQKDEVHQSSGAIQNELNHQMQLSVQYQAIKDLILKVEKEHSPLFYLNILIGDATGNKFAKFAQNLSLKHLISLANIRLKKLNDRYLLADTDIEDDLRVKDLYQGNTERSVKTLSGGETFIVSLAMALSLSDMASQNVKLDSLFIDEGFGTLDQETMEVALITLEKLQSEGNRTIGIISHVESLKERITTQIKVHKDSQGYSKIEVV